MAIIEEKIKEEGTRLVEHAQKYEEEQESCLGAENPKFGWKFCCKLSFKRKN